MESIVVLCVLITVMTIVTIEHVVQLTYRPERAQQKYILVSPHSNQTHR